MDLFPFGSAVQTAFPGKHVGVCTWILQRISLALAVKLHKQDV
jgi:hypothetical protein